MSQTKGKFFLDFESDEQQQQKKNNLVSNQKKQEKINIDDKFRRTGNDDFFNQKTNTKIGKGFFNQQDNGLTFNDQSKNNQIQSHNKQTRQKKRRQRGKKLQPLKPLQHIQHRQIFTPLSQINSLSNLQIKQQPFHKQINIFNKNIQKNYKQQQQQHQQQIHIKKQPIHLSQQNQQLDNFNLQRKQQFKDKKNAPVYLQNQQTNKLQISQSKLIQQSKFIKNSQINLTDFIKLQIPQGRTVRFTIYRQGTGLLQFHPSYNLHFSHDNRYVMSGRKVSNSHLATYNIATNKQDFRQNCQYYLGKVKTNFLRTVCNVLGPGLSPQNALKQNIVPRQVLATVVYINQFFSSGSKPRQFKVYFKKPQIKYYDLQGTKLYQEQISLQDLYLQYSSNRDKILIFRNRKPTWRQQIKGYSLNFRGRVLMPSIKNFILQQDNPLEQQAQQVLLYGRIAQNGFNMDVSYPLSPLIAFGIVLTSFCSV